MHLKSGLISEVAFDGNGLIKMGLLDVDWLLCIESTKHSKRYRSLLNSYSILLNSIYDSKLDSLSSSMKYSVISGMA
jgi:hypothetical protein